MKLGFGRVVPAAPDDERTTAPRAVARRPALARVVPEAVVEASERARDIVARAEAAAAALLADAAARAAELGTELAARARSDAASALAARELAVAAREDNARERHLDDSVALARLLAERLLGEALRADPARVVALARQALTEARGARKITLSAHPDDAPLLERALAAGELVPPVLVAVDPKRRRGSLRLDTELGTLDAELAPQLDRLAEKLREALRHA
ncbi:MAG TPA: FliH/SctL family protein [Polyangiaceae bacterium]|nr:FliH/SctL family protein [Polyangiaceae bacterium]